MNIKNKIINYKEGMKITKPCIIRGMPSEVYHSTIGLSTSGIKMLLLDSPATYYDKYLSGTYIEEEKTCYKIGKACHCLILEGEKVFYDTYWLNPFGKLVKTDLIKELEQREINFNPKDKNETFIELLFIFLFCRHHINKQILI